MAQQIVVCFDGTWNDPTESTNVHRLFDALAAGPAQRRDWVLDPAASPSHPLATSHLERRGDGLLAFYLEGVGATGLHESALDGALGLGLHRRVLQAYLLLSRHYTAGDKLWLFGFSRGAWSARSLAGLLARAGLMSPAQAAAPEAFDEAQRRWLRSKRRNEPLPEGSAYWQAHDEQPVRLVGVWDTVGALGVPLFNGLKAIDRAERQLFDFADLTLGPRVQHGRHALAIDENRHDFEPAAWQPRNGVRQMWFAGAHADVGGGYAQCGLSDLALQWMLDEARALGLPANASALQPAPAPDALQDRHDESRRPLWRLRPVQPRAVPDDAELHPSVFERLQRRPDWRPAALRTLPGLAEFFRSPCPATERLQPLAAEPAWQMLAVGDEQPTSAQAILAWNATGVRLRSGERFAVTVLPGHDTWHDDQVACGPEGYASLHRSQRWAEGARRVAEAPWFALVAAVHASPSLASRSPDEAGLFTGLPKSVVHGVGEIDDDSQLVPLGRDGTFEAACDGYLYLFANDVAWAYGNNHGALRLVVHRIA
jgi:uncharacterized protein (DUF2235 family)